MTGQTMTLHTRRQSPSKRWKALPSPDDFRRELVALWPSARALCDALSEAGRDVSEETCRRWRNGTRWPRYPVVCDLMHMIDREHARRASEARRWAGG